MSGINPMPNRLLDALVDSYVGKQDKIGLVSNLKFKNAEEENWNSLSSQLCSEGVAIRCFEREGVGGDPRGGACS